MPTYKLYLLDEKERIAGPPHIFEAASDKNAIEMARQYPHGKILELWESTRRVTTLKRD